MNPQQWAWGWISWLKQRTEFNDSSIILLGKKVSSLMATVQELKADYEAFKAEMATDLAAINAKVTDLQAQLASQPDTAKEINDLAAEIVQDTTDAHAKAAPTP